MKIRTDTGGRTTRTALAILICLLAGRGSLAADPLDLSRLRYSVAHALLWTTNATGYSSNVRDGYGLAISPDGGSLYLGYNNSGDVGADYDSVLRVQLDPSALTNTLARLYGYRGKAIATDDQGRVYLAEGDTVPDFTVLGIPKGDGYVWWPTGAASVTNMTAWVAGVTIFSPDLSNRLHAIPLTKCGGVVARREGADLVLYVTDRTDKTLSRFVLTESGSDISGHTLAGLDGDGIVAIAGATADGVRGVDIDSNGRIWVADAAGNQVLRCDSDGSNWSATNCANSVIDVSCMDGRVYVAWETGASRGGIYVLDAASMQLIATIPRPAQSVTGFGPDTTASFGHLQALPGAQGIYVQIGSGISVGLTAASNWKNPVLHIESASAGTVFRIR